MSWVGGQRVIKMSIYGSEVCLWTCEAGADCSDPWLMDGNVSFMQCLVIWL